MSLWPKEHGAYGQVALPLVTAFGVAGASPGGLLVAATVVAAFLVHEPTAVVLGLRGPRAKRQLATEAMRWLAVGVAFAAASGLAAVLVMPAPRRWSILIAVAPALFLAAALVRGQEKTWYGELAASLAFAGAAVPISMAAGASVETAASVAIPFALLFIASTLAVRVVILQVRGGGDAGAATISRFAALGVAAGGAGALAALSALRLLPVSVLVAAAPGLVTTVVIAIRRPSPARLRSVGWTLVAVGVLTAAIVIAFSARTG